MECTGAVIIGGYVNALGLARSLTAQGIRVAVLRTQPFDIAHRSRQVEDGGVIDDLAGRPERLLEALDRHKTDWQGRLLLPSNDEGLLALALNHERLSSTYRVAAPLWETTRSFLDKELMHAAASAVGLAMPHNYGPAAAATAKVADLRFPVLVKPFSSHLFQKRFGRKLFVARDPESLRRAIEIVEREQIAAGLFDLVPGDDSEIYAYCTYIGERGEVAGGVTIRKLRQSPPGFGVARVAELVDEIPALREATLALVRHLGFRGMAAAEFKRDRRDGTFRFLEVNARTVVYNALLRRGGLDLAALAWSDYALSSQAVARPSGWRGVWIHLHADLLYSSLYRQGEILSWDGFAAPYRRPKVFAVWSRTDPQPFAMQWGRTLREAVSGLRHGAYRSRLEDQSTPPTDSARRAEDR